MKKYLLHLSIIIGSILFIQQVVFAAPVSTILRNILPETNNTYDIGTTTPSAQWKNLYVQNVTVSGTCTGCTSLSGGSVNTLTFWTSGTAVSATSSPTVGYITATTTTVSTFPGGFLANAASSTITNLTTTLGTSTSATSTNFFSTLASTTQLFTNNISGLLSATAAGLVTTPTVSSPLTFSSNTLACATCLTGNQTITLSGDVSGSGATSITTAIGSNKVTLGMLATLAANSLIGNNTGSTATPVAIATSTLGIAISDTTGTLTVSRGGTGATTITGLVLGNGASAMSAYAGTSCTNQFPRSLSAAGVATCATVSAGDVSLANLTATDSTLTFSGTYNGSTARTIGLNLGNANTWTALQQFGNASTTQLTTTGSTYLATISGNVGIGTTSPGTLFSVHGNAQISNTLNIANVTATGTVAVATTSPSAKCGLCVATSTIFSGNIATPAASTTQTNNIFNINWSNGRYQRLLLGANSSIVFNSTSSVPIDGMVGILDICNTGTAYTGTFPNGVAQRWIGVTPATTTLSTVTNTCTKLVMQYIEPQGVYHIASSTGLFR